MDNRALADLRDALTGYYDDAASIRIIVDDAGLPRGELDLLGAPRNVWHQVLRTADKRDLLGAVIGRALIDLPDNPALLAGQRGLPPDVGGDDIAREIDWRGTSDEETLEKIISDEITFRPVVGYGAGWQFGHQYATFLTGLADASTFDQRAAAPAGRSRTAVHPVAPSRPAVTRRHLLGGRPVGLQQLAGQPHEPVELAHCTDGGRRSGPSRSDPRTPTTSSSRSLRSRSTPSQIRANRQPRVRHQHRPQFGRPRPWDAPPRTDGAARSLPSRGVNAR